jgi:hypothetical protein
LKDFLLELSVFRVYRWSHLDFLISSSDELSKSVKKLGWGRDDLSDELLNTNLVESISKSVFFRIYPAIRRLLFRYRYRTTQKQSEAHKRAADFLSASGTSSNFTGSDKSMVLVECLWHYSEYLRLTRKNNLSNTLEHYAKTLFQDRHGVNNNSNPEVARVVAEGLLQDYEFQESIDKTAFDRVMQIVKGVANTKGKNKRGTVNRGINKNTRRKRRR